MFSSRQATGIPVLLIRAGNRKGALPLEDVIETLRPLPVERLPDMPAFVSGLAILRGSPVPVVDLRVLLGAGGAEPSRRFVAVRLAGRPVVLAVDEVLGVRDMEPSAFQGLPPLLAEAGADSVSAIGALDRELLVLLQCSRGLLEGVEQALRSQGRQA